MLFWEVPWLSGQLQYCTCVKLMFRFGMPFCEIAADNGHSDRETHAVG